jgi:hypothetical protein
MGQPTGNLSKMGKNGNFFLFLEERLFTKLVEAGRIRAASGSKYDGCSAKPIY